MFARRNYRRSNRITCIDFDVSRKCKIISRKILSSRSTIRRQALSDALCEALCESSNVVACSVKISRARQVHKKSNGRTVYKQYGFYRPHAKYIYITNRTAVRGQILAPKTFLNTLLHEWMHHYDYSKLKLNSIHTKGFYLRLKSLEDELRP